jgi:glycosyltransferase involved in cell wall biosynthesis
MKTLRSEDEIIASWISSPSDVKVSICCATYNHGEFIEAALCGFLEQETNFRFEILIHDDASTDQTTAIIKHFQSLYPQLIKPIFQQENQFSQGKKVNIEFNYPRSKGQYIALCEGDDYWTVPYKLQRQIDYLDTHSNCNLVAHAVEVVDQTMITKSYSPYYGAPKAVNTFLDVWFEHFVPTLSLVFRKTALVFPLPDFYSQVFSLDKLQVLLLTYSGYCYYDSQVMGCYRHHDGGITKSKQFDISLFESREYLLYTKVAEYLKLPNKLLQKRLARIDYTVYRLYQKERNYRLMFKAFSKMLSKDKWIFFRVVARYFSQFKYIQLEHKQ